MLSFCPPEQATPRSFLQAPGGFAWWYADALDEHGSGFVCIWAYGLPFLPGYLSGHRAGLRVPGEARPSVNLVLYERGRPISYSLVELPPERATWTDHTWQFGDSVFSHERRGPHLHLHAQLDLPVAGSPHRLRGTFEIVGPGARTSAAGTTDADHLWSPLIGPATARARFEHGDRRLLDLTGSGYHDRNGSAAPLDGLGIRHWTWGRQILGDELLIYYLTWPTAPNAEPLLTAYLIGPDGFVHTAPFTKVELLRPRLGRFGMPWWARLRAYGLAHPLQIDVGAPADDGPFYLRALTRCTYGPHSATGWTELCRPDRIDRAWHRPLVRMCVQHESSPNSAWLPLFTGPTADRTARLWSWWNGGQPRALP